MFGSGGVEKNENFLYIPFLMTKKKQKNEVVSIDRQLTLIYTE
jgi:hypothetical protein